MRLPWEREAILTNPRPVSAKAQELEAAKEILEEIFRVRPADVEDMIQRKLETRSWPEGREDGLWPATFCPVE
jgi:hypothetical protein